MNAQNNIIVYQSIDNKVKLDVNVENDTIWMTQSQIAELYQTERSVITKHLRNIIKSGELQEESICAIFAHMGNDGKQKYETNHYNLDAIISVGYRVNSAKATQFRIWATKQIKEIILKSITQPKEEVKKTKSYVRDHEYICKDGYTISEKENLLNRKLLEIEVEAEAKREKNIVAANVLISSITQQLTLLRNLIAQ